MATVYDFKVLDKKGNEVSLSQYEGKVLLIVNTASKCGFTPQYEELEAAYEKYSDKGFVVLDFPCNQFGEQAPGTDEEYAQFCQMTFGTKFPQFKKSEVNGENELPLYTFLKAQKGFAGFAPSHNLTPILNKLLGEADPNFAEKSDIKWNFTKFLINRQGEVVERFEPTAGLAEIEPAILALL
ncbi:MAG: glutathione peroxidase [Alloprevotella sp.]|nr:glutathione peroxidase [Bacteroidales bacterium]MDY3943391.1 glutathione peroxidase [Alloprevotella sp.]